MATKKASSAKAAAVSALNFEDALQELEAIVRRLESGDTTLEQAIDEYERGSALRGHCEQKLRDARLKVEQILQKDGTAEDPSTESFDIA